MFVGFPGSDKKILLFGIHQVILFHTASLNFSLKRSNISQRGNLYSRHHPIPAAGASTSSKLLLLQLIYIYIVLFLESILIVLKIYTRDRLRSNAIPCSASIRLCMTEARYSCASVRALNPESSYKHITLDTTTPAFADTSHQVRMKFNVLATVPHNRAWFGESVAGVSSPVADLLMSYIYGPVVWKFNIATNIFLFLLI